MTNAFKNVLVENAQLEANQADSSLEDSANISHPKLSINMPCSSATSDESKTKARIFTTLANTTLFYNKSREETSDLVNRISISCC